MVWMIFFFLCVISIIEVFSAASTLTYKSGDHWAPIIQHTSFLMLGGLLVVIFHNIPYKWFKAFPFWLWLASLFLLLLVLGMGVATGDRVNGAARWLSFMGIQFQPSELAKMSLIILTAAILSGRQTEEGANPKAFKAILFFTVPIVLLIMPENLSTAMLLFGVILLLMFIGRVPFKQLALLVGSLVVGGALAVLTLFAIPSEALEKVPMAHRATTWQNRIKKFADKEEVSAAEFDIDKDAQVAHSRIAIATSHVIGKGPGNSVQRDFLSQAFSDFIFAIIIEEMGLLGGAVVVLLYLCLLFRAGYIARRCAHTFPALLVIGIALLLVSQAMLNMMVAVGLFPVTGQPLPLISKGGTSTLINCVYIGMILSVSRYVSALEAQREHDRLITLQIENTQATEELLADKQAAAEPTSEALNIDTKFE